MRTGQKPAACVRNGKNQPFPSERRNNTAAEGTARCRRQIVERELEKADLMETEKTNPTQVKFFIMFAARLFVCCTESAHSWQR